jgi:hypothetical protein
VAQWKARDRRKVGVQRVPAELVFVILGVEKCVGENKGLDPPRAVRSVQLAQKTPEGGAVQVDLHEVQTSGESGDEQISY